MNWVRNPVVLAGLGICLVGILIAITVAPVPGIIVSTVGAVVSGVGRTRADERWLHNRRERPAAGEVELSGRASQSDGSAIR